MHTILYQDVQTLFHQQRRIKDNQSVTERKDVVAAADFEKGSNCSLVSSQRVISCLVVAICLVKTASDTHKCLVLFDVALTHRLSSPTVET